MKRIFSKRHNVLGLKGLKFHFLIHPVCGDLVLCRVVWVGSDLKVFKLFLPEFVHGALSAHITHNGNGNIR